LTMTKDRPTLSSERAPSPRQDRNCQTVTNIWSWAPAGARQQDRLTDWCWYQSRLRYQQANIAVLTSQPGSDRDCRHKHRRHTPVAAAHSTRASLLGRTTRRKPASRCSACTARYGPLLGRRKGRAANCNTDAPFKGQQFHSQPTDTSNASPGIQQARPASVS
jgi:hypothetical protein